MSVDAYDSEILTDNLAWYWITTRHDLLTPEQERELGARIQAGDMAARDTLITSNLRLVWNIAKRYRSTSAHEQGLDLNDLIQHGNLGLLRAAEKFDARRGFRFTTYASYWIEQSIRRAIATEGTTVRLPVHIHERVMKLRKTESALAAAGDDWPADDDLAATLGWTVSQVRAIRVNGALAQVSSLDVFLRSADQRVNDNTDRTLIDTLPNDDDDLAAIEDADARARTRDQIATLLTELDARERVVLRLRYGLGGCGAHTLEQVGRVVGVTRERARQIEGDALKKLRAHVALGDDGDVLSAA